MEIKGVPPRDLIDERFFISNLLTVELAEKENLLLRGWNSEDSG